VTLLAVAGALTACGRPAYQYVGNDQRDLVLRVPGAWTPLRTSEVLNPPGATTTKQAQGWLAYFDGASRPSAEHARTDSTRDPMVMVQSVDIDEATRGTITDDQLRDLLRPVSETARAQLELEAAAANQQVPAFRLLRDEKIRTATQRGVRVRYAYQLGSGVEYFDQVAVTNRDQSRAHLLLVHCRRACFEQHTAEIDATVGSLTVKAR
jgi:hypothetical protein